MNYLLQTENLRMKKYITLLILVTLYSCKPSPSYNAFDDKFDISIRKVINNGCDTISAGCGYINLQQQKGRLRNYYQIFGFNSGVVAKGFVFYLDTLNVVGEKKNTELRSLKIKNKDIESLNIELKKYGYKYYKQKKHEYGSFIEIINYDIKDTVKLEVVLNWNEKKRFCNLQRVKLFHWKITFANTV